MGHKLHMLAFPSIKEREALKNRQQPFFLPMKLPFALCGYSGREMMNIAFSLLPSFIATFPNFSLCFFFPWFFLLFSYQNSNPTTSSFVSLHPPLLIIILFPPGMCPMRHQGKVDLGFFN
jgi:hypothetical protein